MSNFDVNETPIANSTGNAALTFADLNLDARLNRALEELNFVNPTPIQQEAIPVILQNQDVMASAQTGTGKTAAFMLPTLHKLLSEPAKGTGKGPRVLVLSPTRELAQQINDAVRDFGKHTKLRVGTIVGGVSYFNQEKLLSRPFDILVATPGRLMDHMDKGRIDFSRIELLILDEADRMLDMGFVDDVEMIAGKMPAERQTLLFSATLEGEIERVARQLLKSPVRIQTSSVKEKHESITQSVLAADDFGHKNSLLTSLLERSDVKQAIVFVATKSGTEELADVLKGQGISADALHGDMKQGFRRRVLDRMHVGQLKVLVATDVAARGLDVKGISHVINFDLPMVSEDYVHRIGRTGRGGSTGEAVTLVSPREWHKLFRIEQMLGTKLEELIIEGLEPRSGRPSRGGGRSGGTGRGGPSRGGERSGRSFGGGRSQGSRGPSRSDFGGDDRFARDRTERAFGDRPRGDRPQSDRPYGDRPRSDRPYGDRPQGERSYADRPRSERSYENRGNSHEPRREYTELTSHTLRRDDRPRSDRFSRDAAPARDSRGPSRFDHNDRPRSDRPRSDRPSEGARFDRADRPARSFAQGERLSVRSERPAGAAPQGERRSRRFSND
ncbi:DEAD/DEAH box helicase [Permianibacter sp. IMCC34836]|uniref:DEAD/DEAH box helicase n=1 Tax=Permianibacter fluminis TaxID=2738515 RepID=UPI001552BDBC|nr:DEAD/DEAH box helicase [Permianibacter fluminis]NQD37600.1 DEAD/DEAH box helicase [Permianibacter fluminis]